MERGHKNVWDCERIFNEMKDAFRFANSRLLGDFTVATKEDCRPLMVADMLARAHSRLRAAAALGELDMEAVKVLPTTAKGRLVFLELRKRLAQAQERLR